MAATAAIAIVGGVNLILDPERFAQLGRLGILSDTGRCLAFGAEANGTALGEGAGAVVLRSLEDAVARGDRIYGVIKGTGVSTGSGTVGFTAPNPQAQAEAIRRALRTADVDPRTVTYVESHGTGTSLGDPIEVRGLTLGYGTAQLQDPALSGVQRSTIGSIKPNIGHLEAGAGVVSLIKVLLQLQRGQLLPSVTSDEPNPQIPFADIPFSIQRTLAPWDRPVFARHGSPVDVPGGPASVPSASAAPTRTRSSRKHPHSHRPPAPGPQTTPSAAKGVRLRRASFRFRPDRRNRCGSVRRIWVDSSRHTRTRRFATCA